MRKKLDDLSVEFVRSILSYNPITGAFTWLVKPSIRTNAGDAAGSVHKKTNRIIIKIRNKSYLAHRLAWLYVTEYWPINEIDHKDLNGSNNTWSNLREATRSQNCLNKRVRPDCISGVKGVHWFYVTQKWRSNIMIDGKRVFLGSFDDKESAAQAYAKAAAIHGEFARLS